MTNAQVGIMLITILVFFLFVRNVIKLIFGLENEEMHRRRLKQLDFSGNRIGQTQDDEAKEFLNKVTEPVIRYILPNFKYANTEQLNKDLKFSEWDKYMDAIQFQALDIILKVLGVGLFFLLASSSLVFAIAWGVGLVSGLRFLLSNSVKNKKDALFAGFPEFIRLTQGYLTAEMSLVDAIENTIEFVDEDWKPYLKRFAITARISSVRKALTELQEDIEIFEVRELLSLIRLSLDQGIDVKDSFETQTEKVRAMQLEVTMQKIEGRKMMGIALQAPLLLTIIIAFALPTLEGMTNIA